ncbi:uncharacterized protein LACBIDRAFT_321002 [Laccaria bicolor S238N-H82]|uniref:Predicted protein n=1 Tax=Laccaria bicolor (strain S238N-H82 / ATCC MYA-4686) TaxID=486041 RepID=B0CNG6_LACBS|nr:uncharacterized protein LACBIDRAFT_321002 [Laccaria bicolor S238N-H82]EDR15303.1 predicted protein [Laccaria bicolor S238N-H82]|eukprot:XP_001873511.1 predicted protein [Laccaria bicolor S238N-H82]
MTMFSDRQLAQDVDGLPAPATLAHFVIVMPELEPNAPKVFRTSALKREYSVLPDSVKPPLNRSHVKCRRQREERNVKEGQYPRSRVIEKYAQTSSLQCWYLSLMNASVFDAYI